MKYKSIVFFDILTLLHHQYIVYIMDVQNSRIGKRLRAIGMLESGISQKQIAQTLGVTIKTVWNWKTKILSGKSMAGKPRSGRQYYIKEILEKFQP